MKSSIEYEKEVLKDLEQSSDTLNHFIAHLFGGSSLSDKQEEMFQKFQAIALYFRQGHRTEKIVQIMKAGDEQHNIPPTSEVNARKMIHYVKKIWGDGEQNYGKFELWAAIEFHEDTAEKAKTAGNFQAATRAKIEADTLKGLYLQSEGNANPEDWMNPKSLIIIPSSNAKILDEGYENEEETVDIDE